MAMVPGGHASEDALEQYCLGLVPAGELEAIESHLLVCKGCQERLRETEAYVRTMQQATAQAAADDLVRRSRWRALGDWVFHTVPVTAIGAAVALALAWGFLPSFRHAPPAVAVALEVTRGDEGPRAHAPAGRALLLKLDLAGVPALESYQVRIVNARGGAVFGAAARPERGRLNVTASVHPSPGAYWVRLYDPSHMQTPLREYGLALE
jgi:hypothetical protein